MKFFTVVDTMIRISYPTAEGIYNLHLKERIDKIKEDAKQGDKSWEINISALLDKTAELTEKHINELPYTPIPALVTLHLGSLIKKAREDIRIDIQNNEASSSSLLLR